MMAAVENFGYVETHFFHDFFLVQNFSSLSFVHFPLGLCERVSFCSIFSELSKKAIFLHLIHDFIFHFRSVLRNLKGGLLRERDDLYGRRSAFQFHV